MRYWGDSLLYSFADQILVGAFGENEGYKLGGLLGRRCYGHPLHTAPFLSQLSSLGGNSGGRDSDFGGKDWRCYGHPQFSLPIHAGPSHRTVMLSWCLHFSKILHHCCLGEYKEQPTVWEGGFWVIYVYHNTYMYICLLVGKPERNSGGTQFVFVRHHSVKRRRLQLVKVLLLWEGTLLFFWEEYWNFYYLIGKLNFFFLWQT